MNGRVRFSVSGRVPAGVMGVGVANQWGSQLVAKLPDFQSGTVGSNPAYLT